MSSSRESEIVETEPTKEAKQDLPVLELTAKGFTEGSITFYSQLLCLPKLYLLKSQHCG